ncbi:MAG: DEAD/DEAH box helicase [Legionella sp.]|nr:DEAD/DEAH box helicase [Legionella sp.]
MPTEPQIQGWPHILAGKNTLISAPTGSGKTLTAFLICLDQLVRQALAFNLPQTEVLYISPLKALGNDVRKNLLTPLAEIKELALEQGLPMADIEVVVRSGDTPAKERQAMLKKPPHILVTTPETLYILLTADKSREILKTIHTVIIDEIHALADDKRGAHLTLSLERLEALLEKPPLRIGLSATQKPLDVMGHFLVGNGRPLPELIDIGHARNLELAVEVPQSELGAVASNQAWEEIYDRLAEFSAANRSTLIFANTRRVAERVAHHLAERLGKDQVLAHHGSLAKKLRLVAEDKLKNGELKALVATASLELGIDIGSVDLVCQLGSPRSIAVMLQRAGRAGHWHGAISKARIFATTRDELVECAALVQSILEGDLDKLIIPQQPMDILTQQIVAACAAQDWEVDALYQLVCRAFHYQNLSREEFDEVIEMLAEGIAGARGRYSAYLFYDRTLGVVKARRGSRLAAITSGGAIPETGLFTVKTLEPEATVGTLDEDFAIDSHQGDVILLGSTSWRIKRIDATRGQVTVEDAHGAPPTVPFWRGEAPERTAELSQSISRLRETVIAQLGSGGDEEREQVREWLINHCHVTTFAATQIINYLLEGHTLLGAVPTHECIIAERFFDESGGMQLVIHTPFGARLNKAWGLALRKCFCRSFNVELQASATDNGINIALTEQHSFPLADVFNFVSGATAKEIVTQAILQSPLFPTRWRWDACRALALLRFQGGKKVPPHLLRMRSDDLLAAVFPEAVACQDNLGGKKIKLPEHPLINETMKDALHEALNIDGLLQLLQQMKEGKITCLAVDTPVPSVFAHEILNANPYAFLDDAPLEERRARAVEMRQTLPLELVKELGTLDTEMIDEVRRQAWPDIRSADELHDVLQSIIALPLQEHNLLPNLKTWAIYIDALVASGRAGKARISDQDYLYAIDKATTFSGLYPQAQYEHALTSIERKPLSPEDGIYYMIRGWLYILGPVTSEQLQQLLSLPLNEVEQTLIRIEASGQILRGVFSAQAGQEWCERRLLARIHRLTLAKLRREIEPVSAAVFMRWLLNWQHVAPGTQLSGEQGLLAVIEQLQGFELPAKSWEPEIFAKRVKNYDPMLLDKLCLMGVVGWGRLSSTINLVDNQLKRIVPTSVAPITFYVRDKAGWLADFKQDQAEDELSGLSHVALAVYQYLREHGASFFMEIAESVPHLKTEIEMGLWELVSVGLMTADLFDNLRSIIDPKRRLLKKRRRPVRHQYSAGRWSLLKKRVKFSTREQIEASCWILLKRYGVLFRDLLAREKNVPSWRELYSVLRLLEERGEVRGGRFIEGVLGEQFALPIAIESLRAMKKEPIATEQMTVAAVDPLNLSGSILPGPRIAAYSGNQVIV